ncbi:pirin family protein [Mycobacterium sp. KBS0706]|uniref:pirin family protein n=1 Tax=Mycobacterium sp. KBS0706 TaxID=2578109 RepID=UPI00110FD27F|nr:pirin family protein [Mycobacterium sp. KBS0706]TSD86599.1 pirin family protein [Mycobacterium sp. KBS0706]
MSWQPTRDPAVGETPCPFIETVVIPRTADIGGFEVRRAVPSMQKRSVGPFVFVDEMGPTLFGAGEGVDVPPHPHIGLATVTYLFAGEQTHLDSLGTRQLIRPGDVNWMTAGSGIAHSERTPPALRATGSTLFGVQTWVALPAPYEEVAPSFAHHGVDDLPVIEDAGKSVRLIVGSAYGARSPVATFSETLYLDAALQAGAVLPLPAEHEERAVYVVSGRVRIGDDDFPPQRLLVLRPGDMVEVEALEETRLLVFGGEPLDGPRKLWWNFVARSRERIEQAKEDWREGRFGTIPDETERLPLPER